MPSDEPTRKRRSGNRHREWARRVIARDGRCATCGTTDDLTADHIIPLEQGGAPYDLANGQTLCRSCNSRKGQAEKGTRPPAIHEPVDDDPPAPGRPYGRGTKLNTEVIQTIARAMLAGSFFRDACRHAGIHEATAYRWLARADEPEPEPLPDERPVDYQERHHRWRLACEFRDATEKAEADAKIGALARIQKAGREGTWQADAWYLERRYPHEYGRRAVEVSGPAGGPVQIDDGRDTIEALIADPELLRAVQAHALADDE